MTLGLAIILIFILYLINKHDRWRQAAKIGVGLVILCILGVGGIFGWKKYESWQETQQRVKLRAACLESAKKATTDSFIPEISVCNNNPDYRWPPACKNGLVVGCVDDSPQPWKKYGATQIYELDGKQYEVPKDTTLDELNEAIKKVAKDPDYANASPEDQKGYLAYLIDTNKRKRSR